jgi:hypothetical protein
MKKLILPLFLISIGCTSAPKFNTDLIRPWNKELGNEYPGEKPVIAFYEKGPYELYYLAANHTSTVGSDTFVLVQKLFDENKFKAVLLEPFPNSSGESPKWFVDDSKSGKSDKMIEGGESALAAILADEKKIPFFGGEPDHLEIYKFLKSKGRSDEDILSFYVVRQIPQWVRQTDKKDDLIRKKVPGFLAHYCHLFSIRYNCTKLNDVMAWYKRNKNDEELTIDISSEELAPYSDGELLTQKISSEIGQIRDKFTLNVIEKLLEKYKKVAVIYGSGHFVTLRKSFEEQFSDQPKFIEAPQVNSKP